MSLCQWPPGEGLGSMEPSVKPVHEDPFLHSLVHKEEHCTAYRCNSRFFWFLCWYLRTCKCSHGQESSSQGTLVSPACKKAFVQKNFATSLWFKLDLAFVCHGSRPALLVRALRPAHQVEEMLAGDLGQQPSSSPVPAPNH